VDRRMIFCRVIWIITFPFLETCTVTVSRVMECRMMGITHWLRNGVCELSNRVLIRVCCFSNYHSHHTRDLPVTPFAIPTISTSRSFVWDPKTWPHLKSPCYSPMLSVFILLHLVSHPSFFKRNIVPHSKSKAPFLGSVFLQLYIF
jgi:hypothetical protein